ncbi:hypothetical protein [Jannaschia sp. R86511]|uniref:hypothetical protein n=1 Tax=Jannaschia sp. R86511 TaxID=3093853 RepID=UPI0036D2AC27
MSPAPARASVPPLLPGGGEDVERLTAAALAVPGVTGLHGGQFGEVATYLPGRRVVGIRASATSVTVHVVVTAAALPAVLTSVRAAITGVADGRTVDVVIADLHQAPDPTDDPPSGPRPPAWTPVGPVTPVTPVTPVSPVPPITPTTRPGPGDSPAMEERTS